MKVIRVKLKKGEIPRKYIRIDKGPTIALMHKDSGKLLGRVKSIKKDDGTKVRRIRSGFDIDNDGISDGGQIYGRVSSRASKRARGYVRKL